MEFDGQSQEDTAITAEEAGDAFANLLGPEEDADTGEERALSADEADEDVDVDLDDADLDVDADPDLDDEAADSEAQAGDEAKPTLHRVKVDGQEREVSTEELIRGYQLETAARDRMEKAAAKSQALDAEYAGLTAFQQRVSATIEALGAKLQGEVEAVDWEALRQNDPAEYAAKREDIREQQARLQQLQADRDKLAGAQASRAAEARSARLANERTALAERMGWMDPKTGAIDSGKAQAAASALATFAQETYGVSAAEFDAIEDHRVVLAINDAHRYRQLKAKAQATGERARAAAAPTGAVLKPGASEGRPNPGQTQLARAAQRLKQTGSTRDAADAIAALL